ncbi:MAG: dihydropyrimidinase [bacterium]|nr:dihydropyrimidinase [bacterium]
MTLIANATLVTGAGAFPGSLRTDGERIAEVVRGELTEGDAAALARRHGDRVVDGRGKLLVPGGVDPHVHFALPVAGTVTVDDFASGSIAALAGGTTTIIDFVTPSRDESLVDATEARLAEAAACACDYGLHMSVTAWREGMAAEMAACRERGLVSAKMYLAYLESIGLVDAALEPAMRAAAELDLVVLLHCEDGVAVSARQQELLAAGRTGPDAHPLSRPAQMEEDSVRHALDMARRTGCRPYVVHISAAGSVAAVTEAKFVGLTCYAETCPQYLMLEDSVYSGSFLEGAAHIMSPPLRPEMHRARLVEALARGEFDVVATDHCSFDLHGQKDRIRDDFTRIPGGAAGVEHRLSLLHTIVAQTGALGPTDWVRMACEMPARIFGLWPRKGSLQPGADADLVLWDPAARRTIRAADDHHRCDHSIFEGRQVVGRPAQVWSRGELVVDDGIVLAAPGRGRFVGA